MFLGLEEGRTLVKLARGTVESYLRGNAQPAVPSSNQRLFEPQGVFVSLLDVERDRAIRGCMGAPFPDRPLFGQVARVAVEAAVMDPRFDPVDLDEFRKKIVLEVTILTSPDEVVAKNFAEFEDNIVVGRDGLIVEGLGSRGLLLPQVAVEQEFDTEEFLSQCCLKAALPPDAWVSGIARVWRFQAQIFSEDGPGGNVRERLLKGPSLVL